jgi:prophage DNA circulation protein
MANRSTSTATTASTCTRAVPRARTTTATRATGTATTPALLIAWQVHGDPTRDLELVARNEILDPNFAPGGEPLEVLSA